MGVMQVSTEITEVNLSAFVYKLFHEDLSPIYGTGKYKENNVHGSWKGGHVNHTWVQFLMTDGCNTSKYKENIVQ